MMENPKLKLKIYERDPIWDIVFELKKFDTCIVMHANVVKLVVGYCMYTSDERVFF